MRSHGSYLLYSLGLRVWCFVVRRHAIKHVRVINSRGWGIERVRRDQETRGIGYPASALTFGWTKREGGQVRPPSRTKGPSTLGCYGSSDLVDGRVTNVPGLNLRRSVKHFRQGLQHLCITSAAIGFRVLLLIPETDSNRFPSGWSDERDLVLEAFLSAKQGMDFLLERLGKVSNAIDFQTHGNVSSNHSNLLSGRLRCEFR